MVFGVISCNSIDFIIVNLKTCHIFPILENIERKYAIFTKKWVARNFNARLLKITFSNRSQARKVLETPNLAKFEEKMVQKNCGFTFVNFRFFW